MTEPMPCMLTVEVIYLPANHAAFQVRVTVAEGASVMMALNQSGIYEHYPETRQLPVGIFGKLAAMNDFVKDGDRIELYRPLELDPKEKRRKRAANKN